MTLTIKKREVSSLPSPGLPMVDQNGKPSIPWYRSFLEMYNASGLGNSTVKRYKKLSVGSLSMEPDPTSAPTVTEVVSSVYAYSYNNTSERKLYALLELPADYVDGSNLYPYVRWAQDGTNTGDCVWRIAYSVASEDGVVSAATSVESIITAPGVSDQHTFSELSEITGTDFKSGDVVSFMVARVGNDAEDTLTDDAFLFSAGFSYLVGVSGLLRRSQ